AFGARRLPGLVAPVPEQRPPGPVANPRRRLRDTVTRAPRSHVCGRALAPAPEREAADQSLSLPESAGSPRPPRRPQRRRARRVAEVPAQRARGLGLLHP